MPFLNNRPSSTPPAIPISAWLASPGPFTAHPITATVISASIPCKNSSTSFAIGIKSICVLPHVGHAINVGESLYKLQSFNISFTTFISFIGSSDKDTLTVSPIPFLNKYPKPILDFTVPLNSVPASVTPKCNGQLKVLDAFS